MSLYASAETQLAEALEHLLRHYVADVDFGYDLTVVQQAVEALASVGVTFGAE